MGQRWADEQKLRWPIQDLQPWANRATSDGPMEGQCIRAIWGGSNPQFLEHFSVNLARSAKIDNSSVQSGEHSDFSHKIIKSNV